MKVFGLIEKVKKDLGKNRKAMEGLLSNDQYADFLLTTSAGKVGAPFVEPEISNLYSEAKKRCDAKIPPGYEDLKEK
jgi:hypothetical protein